MKIIILAAGKWTRLKPLTNSTPKPILKVFWKTIIKHNLEKIYKYVNEIIIVVKYKKDSIINTLWDNYNWVKITYHHQWEEKWTAYAIKGLNINEDFILLNWDSIFWKKDLKNLFNLKWYWCLVKKTSYPEKYWIFKKENNIAKQIIEKPKKYVWNIASVWAYKFSKDIFKYIPKIKKSSRWEFEITDIINLFIKDNNFQLIKINENFIDIWYPWDILNANSFFTNNLEKSIIKWTIEKDVQIKGNIILEKWAILKSGTYIEWNIYIWENSSIWPNTYLRANTVIWKNCKIGNAVEIKNSNIWDNTNIAHLSYIWDSIIWNNVNIWWGFISANLRHDNKNIKVKINWELIDSNRRKLWCIIWDNTKTWINNSTYPGRIIENDKFLLPWEIIK